MFHQRRYTDGKSAHEQILDIISHWEVQLKTSVRYHYAPVSMAAIEKPSYVTCCEDATGRRPSAIATLKNSVIGFYKLSIHFPYDPAACP